MSDVVFDGSFFVNHSFVRVQECLMPDNSHCPLYRATAGFVGRYLNRRYYRCSGCGSVFPDRHRLPSPEEEKERYLQHNNDVNDSRYQRFVEPITDGIKRWFTPTHKGLDYGAGHVFFVQL